MYQNTMYVNYMTKTYHNFLKSQEAKQTQAKPVSFADKIAEKRQEAAGGEQMEIAAKEAGPEDKTNAVGMGQIEIAAGELTLEEYKQYIHDKISQIPVSPSQMNFSFSVHISDEGFEAMKADPEYEKWVLDTLKQSFGFDNPWAGICGGSYVVHQFGASKEEYSGQSWNAGFQNGKGESLFQQKAEDSFWERRMRRSKELQEQLEELQMKRLLDKRLLGEDYMQQTYFSAELLFGTLGHTEAEN